MTRPDVTAPHPCSSKLGATPALSTRHWAGPISEPPGCVGIRRREGGGVLRETLRDIDIAPDRRLTLLTDAGRREVDGLLLATGAWSKRWAAKLGARIPMDSERGYHVMLSDPVEIPINLRNAQSYR